MTKMKIKTGDIIGFDGGDPATTFFIPGSSMSHPEFWFYETCDELEEEYLVLEVLDDYPWNERLRSDYIIPLIVRRLSTGDVYRSEAYEGSIWKFDKEQK